MKNSQQSKSVVIPRVLLRAKEQALKGEAKGPWDKGHWANRK